MYSQLAYALLVHFETSGDATSEGKMCLSNARLGMAMDDVGGMPPLNMKLAEKALYVIFSCQLPNGSAQPLPPPVHCQICIMRTVWHAVYLHSLRTISETSSKLEQAVGPGKCD